MNGWNRIHGSGSINFRCLPWAVYVGSRAAGGLRWVLMLQQVLDNSSYYALIDFGAVMPHGQLPGPYPLEIV